MAKAQNPTIRKALETNAKESTVKEKDKTSVEDIMLNKEDGLKDISAEPVSKTETDIETDIETAVITPGVDPNLPAVASTDDQLIDETVAKINELVGDNLLKTATDVGSYILKHFYGDNIEEAMSKNPHKHNSYRKLQDRLDLKIHYKTLNQMVNITIQERFLVGRLTEEKVKLLSYSQRVELLPRNQDTKLTLAQKCIEENLTIKQMRAAISKNKTKPVSGKKKFIDPFIHDVIAKYSVNNITDKDFEKLPIGKIETMLKNIEDFEKDMETVIAQLDIIKKKLKPLQLEKSKPKQSNPVGRPSNKKV
jgi:hypothetical protein